MRTYKLYASSANATTNNIAAIVFARPGRIRGVRWAAQVDGGADNGVAHWELSLQPVGQHTVNDSVGAVDIIYIYHNAPGTGLAQSGVNVQRTLDMPVAAGERAYLNVSVSGVTTTTATVFIDVDEGRGS